MLLLNSKSPASIAQDLAKRVKQRRLELNETQKRLAKRSGLALSTYRRFEQSGEINLQNLILIAMALGAEGDFEHLFLSPQYEDIEELIQEPPKKRQRGRK